MSSFTPVQLNHQFKFALREMMESPDNFFVTGRAGSGKSTLLKLFRRSQTKKCVVLAPTGIAALNVEGQTIHSFFKFPSRPLKVSDISLRRNRKIYELLELLIIDEISMARADLFDAMDRFLRLNRNRPELPFGGVQLILFGDVFQLPPVVASQVEREYFTHYYKSPFFFDAKVFQDGFSLQLIELTQVFRQREMAFKKLLEQVRMNQMDYDSLEELNSRAEIEVPNDLQAINLCTTNAIAERINKEKLVQLPGEFYRFMAKIGGKYKESRYPTDDLLQLKENAQIMFIRNDYEKDYVNGTLGRIARINGDEVYVEYLDTKGNLRTEQIVEQKWELLEYEVKNDDIETKVVGTFHQLPLKLAWAISIHKSQGQSYNNVVIHMGRGAFESGQTYVALSRCTSLQGLYLSKKLRMRDIFVDERLINFYQRILM